jgi:pantothenate kinase type III
MLLVADIGNTNITFGLYEQANLCAQWRLSSGVARTDDEVWILIKMPLESENFALQQLTGFAVSSVVPTLTPVLERVGANRLKVPMVNVTADLDTGIKILYENPHQVGADRICNAVAGFARYGGPLVVVDFGTATTYDVITANAEYLGGIIAPGPETTAEILHRAAAGVGVVFLSRRHDASPRPPGLGVQRFSKRWHAPLAGRTRKSCEVAVDIFQNGIHCQFVVSPKFADAGRSDEKLFAERFRLGAKSPDSVLRVCST